MIGTCWIPTGHWYSHAPQVVHSNAASMLSQFAAGLSVDAFTGASRISFSSGTSLAGPNSFRYTLVPRMISFGFSTFPVVEAGQCSVHRPHSTQL